MSSNDPFEDRLRQVLLAEAQTVTPAGDGLSQIRAKVARRRDRLRWLRPGLAVATAAALGGVAVFAFSSLGESAERTLRQDRQPASRPPSSTAAPAPVRSAPPTPPVSSPAYTIWPYTSPPKVSSGPPSYLDPKQTALGFVRYLQAAEVDQVLADETETTSAGAGRKVTLGRKMADGTVRAVTVVHLVRLGSGSTAPYAVTRAAGAYTLKITSPGLAAPVRSPLTVRGTIDGVHQSIRVEVRTPAGATPISAPVSAPGSATTGWSTPVSFAAPASGVGTLVARTDSDAGDGAIQITAQPVLLPAGGSTPTVVPVARPAADGDIDGDGRPDPVTVTTRPYGPTTVNAGLTRLGEQSVPVEASGAAGVPTVIGTVDADADGYAEVFVKVDQGAATGFASILRLVDDRLVVVTLDGSQARLAYGGSAGHQDSFGCAELNAANPGRELFVWSGTSSDGLAYSGFRTVYGLDRGGLQSFGARSLNLGAGQSAPTGCGSLRYL